MTAARPGWHPRARLFATRSPVLLQNNRSRSRKDLSISSVRAMQLQAGQPEKKGNKRGAAYTYNIKELRNREIDVATLNMPTNSSSADGSGVVPQSGARVPPMRSDDDGCAAGLASSGPALCHAVTRASAE